MKPKITIVAALTQDMINKAKDEKTSYGILKLAANESADKSTYFTSFAYGVSEDRAKRYTKGSLLHITGSYRDEISLNPELLTEELTAQIMNAKDVNEVVNLVTKALYINRVINNPDIEVIYHKADQNNQ